MPEVEPALRLAPHSVPLGGDPATCRAGVHARGADQGTRRGDEEESRRHDA